MTETKLTPKDERDNGEQSPAPGMHVLIHNSWATNDAGGRYHP